MIRMWKKKQKQHNDTDTHIPANTNKQLNTYTYSVSTRGSSLRTFYLRSQLTHYVVFNHSWAAPSPH